jgi:hypothetical protein
MKEVIDRSIAAMKGSLELIGLGFDGRGGSDLTEWDVCTECGNAEWRGHKETCSKPKRIDDIELSIKELQGLSDVLHGIPVFSSTRVDIPDGDL